MIINHRLTGIIKGKNVTEAKENFLLIKRDFGYTIQRTKKVTTSWKKKKKPKDGHRGTSYSKRPGTSNSTITNIMGFDPMWPTLDLPTKLTNKQRTCGQQIKLINQSWLGLYFYMKL